MYNILDLTKNPPSIIPDLKFDNEKDALEWVEQNGGIMMYTVITSL
jgi:hypothetical protein